MSHDFSTVTLIYATRKARQCFWCRDPLPVGSEAVKIAAKADGVFAVFYVHPECNDAWLRDPCCEDDAGCLESHLRGQTCEETSNQQEGAKA